MYVLTYLEFKIALDIIILLKIYVLSQIWFAFVSLSLNMSFNHTYLVIDKKIPIPHSETLDIL